MNIIYRIVCRWFSHDDGWVLMIVHVRDRDIKFELKIHISNVGVDRVVAA
jgi:hypothetical protein